MKVTKSNLADLSLLLAQVIWGSTFFIVKDIQKFVPAMVLLTYRFLIPTLIFAGYLLLKKKAIFSNLKTGFILGLVLWLGYASQTIGLNITSAANSAFITGLFVVFIPLIAILFGQRSFPKKNYVSWTVSLLGLWILTGGIYGINKGDMITLITALAVASHVLLTDHFVKEKIDPYILSFQQLFFVGLFSLFFALIFKMPFAVPNQKILLEVLYLAIFASLLVYGVQTVAQKYTSPIKVGLIFGMETVFASLFTWTLGGEQFTPLRAFGGLLIFLAILITELPIEKIKILKQISILSK